MSAGAALDVVGICAVAAGLAIATVGVLGLWRMPGALARVQAASTVPIAAVLIVLAAPLIAADLETAGRAALVIVFLVVTAPVSAHLTARAASHRDGEDAEDERG